MIRTFPPPLIVGRLSAAEKEGGRRAAAGGPVGAVGFHDQVLLGQRLSEVPLKPDERHPSPLLLETALAPVRLKPFEWVVGECVEVHRYPPSRNGPCKRRSSSTEAFERVNAVETTPASA